MNDSRSSENEIIQLMLYREAFLPPNPSARELNEPLARKIEAFDQRLTDAPSRTFFDSNDEGSSRLYPLSRHLVLVWHELAPERRDHNPSIDALQGGASPSRRFLPTQSQSFENDMGARKRAS